MGTQASWRLSLGFFLPVICLSYIYLSSLLCGCEGYSEAGAPPAHSPDPLLVLCFLGECPPLVQKILVFWVMNWKSKCAYMNFHVRNKRFLVQQQNSMAGARVLPLPPFAGKVYNLMVIGERIENEFSAKSGPLSEPQCICQKMFSAALSDTQMVLLRDLGTHSSVDCSFCKYFLNDSCRQKPQVRCGWNEKGWTQHWNLDLFYFS